MEKGSLGHIRSYVNDTFLREVLNNLIFTASPSLAARASASISWVSPLEQEKYAEYCDDKFLRKCGLGDQACAELGKFWPTGGPSWDALATVPLEGSSQGIVLVEGKAHLGELKEKDRTQAKRKESLDLIEKSLEKTRKHFKASTGSGSWHNSHYQVCNRLAHLYFLTEVLNVPTWLVYLFVVDAPEWPADKAKPGQWTKRFTEVRSVLGLPANSPLQDRILVVFVPPATATPGKPAPR